MRKFFKYILPLGLIVLSILAVVVMVTVANSKRPDRDEAPDLTVRVDAIPAEVA